MSNTDTNRLRLARKRLGLEQKQIARLLGYKDIHQVSRYENGSRTPSLKPILKFSILYKLPIRVLFFKCYQECLEELNRKAKTLGYQSILNFDLTEPVDFCSYLEIMHSGFFNDIDKEKIRRHAKAMFDERRSNVLGHSERPISDSPNHDK